MRAIIIANGRIDHSKLPRSLVAPTDLIICADGGASNALALGLQPQIVIGDLDSLDESLRSQLKEDGCHFIPHSARKDETDLELAMKYAVEKGAREVLILGALGYRFDHALANVLLLALPELRSTVVKILDGQQEICLIRDETLIMGRIGDTLSLLPLTEQVTGICTEGLEYPLQDDTLYLGPSRGISNILTSPQARIRIGQGLLLAVMIHTGE